MADTDQIAESGERMPLTDNRHIESTLNALLFGAPDESAQEPEAGEAPPAEEPESEPVEAEAEAVQDAEAEADTEESPEAEEPNEEAPVQPRRFRVQFEDGNTDEVTEEELIKGYRRERDYTRKTQELAEARKKWEAEEVAALRAERERYAQALPEIENALKPETPDWDKIRAETPEQFPAIYAAWKVADERYQAVRAERERAELQVQRDRAESLAKLLQAERERLYEKVPELKEPDKAKSLASYLRETYGFTEEEIAGTTRHELLVMANKAKAYDDLMKQKSKLGQQAEAPKIKPAKPGAPPSTKPKPSELDRAATRLRKTGSTDDLATVLRHVLK